MTACDDNNERWEPREVPSICTDGAAQPRARDERKTKNEISFATARTTTTKARTRLRSPGGGGGEQTLFPFSVCCFCAAFRLLARFVRRVRAGHFPFSSPYVHHLQTIYYYYYYYYYSACNCNWAKARWFCLFILLYSQKMTACSAANGMSSTNCSCASECI